MLDGATEVTVVDEGDEVYLEADLPESFDDARVGVTDRRATSSRSASSTPTSRSATAARRSWTSTSSAP